MVHDDGLAQRKPRAEVDGETDTWILQPSCTRVQSVQSVPGQRAAGGYHAGREHRGCCSTMYGHATRVEPCNIPACCRRHPDVLRAQGHVKQLTVVRRGASCLIC